MKCFPRSIGLPDSHGHSSPLSSPTHSSQPPNPTSYELKIPIFVRPSPLDTLKVQYARVSLPLPRGAFSATPSVLVEDPRGKAVPVQSELLARWPDHTPRMLHLTFPADGGVYEATIGSRASSIGASESGTIKLKQEGSDHLIVETGRLTAKLGGVGLVESVQLGNHEMIPSRGLEIRVLDGRGRAFTATAAKHVTTQIEVEGPLRTVVALQGKCTLGEETFLDFRLRFEFLAGVEGFSLAYTFFNLEHGQDFFDVQGIELELHLGATSPCLHTVYQQSHGLFSTLGRVVTTPQPLRIRADDTKALAYVQNYEALADPIKYPFYLNPPCDKVDNWAVVSDGTHRLQVEMDDFHLMRPKSLSLEGNVARFGIWPSWAGTLKLQQGRSRQVTIRVALSDQGAPGSQSEAIAGSAQLRNVWRAHLSREVYAAADFFDQGRVLPCQPHAHPRFEQWFAGLASSLASIATFFDLGDLPDSGYQASYIAIGNRIRRIRGEDGGRRYFSTTVHYPATRHNGLEDFEVVWVNNEYDVIFVLGTEFLRTGDPSLFQRLRWWARHTIDVDFLHYSDHKWLHRATPAHCQRHTSTGAYPSHFWTQGLAQYYMLTGDVDALEVIIALADKTIENLDDPVMGELCSGLNREIGWGILTLVCAYEASGLKRFDDYARRLLDQEIGCGLPNDIPLFSIMHTTILLGARQYLQVHAGEKGAEPVRQWFLDLVDLAIRSSRRAPSAVKMDDVMKSESRVAYQEGGDPRGLAYLGLARNGIFSPYSMALDAFAYAYEITRDAKYIEAGLRSVEALLDSPDFHAALQFYHPPVQEAKPYAMKYRTFINYFKAAAELGCLAAYDYKH